MGPVGVQEMIVIFLVALVLFGPKKLPELGKTIAKAITEFRRAQSDLKATFDREMQSIERENELVKEATRTAFADVNTFGEFDLAGGANGTYGAGTVSSPQTPTLSASAVPGAESPTGTETAAHVASLLDPSKDPPAAALEPGPDYGQPVDAAQAFEAARVAAIDAAIDASIAETQGHPAPVLPAVGAETPAGAPSETPSETKVAANQPAAANPKPVAIEQTVPGTAQHS